MGVAWVAGSVRAEALLSRRLGTAGARALAAGASLTEALTELATTSYRHDIGPDQTLDQAEHAIGSTLLWHMRVLGGWQPRPRAELIRILAGGFEIANVDDLLRRAGTRPYRLGTLATAWPALAGAGSPEQVRQVLAASAWGDPGPGGPVAIGLGMRLGWADRVIGGVPDAASWAAGAAALLVAREMYVLRRPLSGPPARRASALLGTDAVASSSLPEYIRLLPVSARWALAHVRDPLDLWRAEARWWAKVEADGFGLVRASRFDSRALVGALAVLAADAWRVRAALQVAARGGTQLEAFDAVA